MCFGCLLLMAIPLYCFIKSGLWLGAVAWVGMALLRSAYLLHKHETNRAEYGLALIYPIAFFFQRQFDTLVLMVCVVAMSGGFVATVEFSGQGYWSVAYLWASFTALMIIYLTWEIIKGKDKDKPQASDLSLILLAPVWVTVLPWLALIDDQT